ncbi:MAG: hypothetical protein ACE5HS_02210 [bacterium]
MKARIAFVAIFLLPFFLFPPLFAKNHLVAPLRSIGDGPNFCLDYSNFQGIDGQTYVEFYVQISYDALQFIRHRGRFRAEYEISFSLQDLTGRVVEQYENRDVVEVESYRETNSRKKARTMLLAYSLQPGEYKLNVVVKDLETLHTAILSEHTVVKNFASDGLHISDIQLSQKIVPAKEGEPYVKNQRYIEPNAGRIFTPGLSKHIFIYFEVYNLNIEAENKNSTYTSYYTFQNLKDDKNTRFKRTNIKPGHTSAHSLRIPLENFSGGEYILTVHVQDDVTGTTSEASRSFTVVETPVSLTEAHIERHNP